MPPKAKLPEENDLVELVVDLPEYGLKKGQVGKILVVYDTYDMKSQESDFEVYFEDVGTSFLLLESQFKLI